MFPPEECAVANYTETFKKAWGWADVRCNDKFVYMCKTIRECTHCNGGPC